jgi:chemotaxis protein methyltransferase CheR
MSPKAMDRGTFKKFCDLVYEKSGIHLTEQKEALLCSRVGKRMRVLGIEDYRDYLKKIVADDDGDECVQLLDAVSTNVTSFFREPVAFTFFTQEIEKWWQAGQRQFRFWSAACSTGEEPYTLLMTYFASKAGNVNDVRVLATDISTRALLAGKNGTYASEKLSTVPSDYVRRWFHREEEDGEKVCVVSDELKHKVSFNRLNLSDPPFPMKGPFDVVFCRNVMIYFDMKVRENLVLEIHRLLRKDGFLILGQSEGLTGLTVPFRTVRPSIYQKDE